jgi:hypothetical protein
MLQGLLQYPWGIELLLIFQSLGSLLGSFGLPIFLKLSLFHLRLVLLEHASVCLYVKVEGFQLHELISDEPLHQVVELVGQILPTDLDYLLRVFLEINQETVDLIFGEFVVRSLF